MALSFFSHFDKLANLSNRCVTANSISHNNKFTINIILQSITIFHASELQSNPVLLRQKFSGEAIYR